MSTPHTILRPVPMFHTPGSVDALFDWLDALSGTERLIAITAAMMTWNLCARLTDPNGEGAA